jgi:phosphoribosylamine--glycine ligase
MRSATQVVGSYSPVPAFTKDIETMIMGTLMRPLLKAFTSEGIKYKGFISVDLLLDKDRVKVLELHCWFGDLESQTILPRIKTDFIEMIMAVIEERLFDVEIEWEQGSSVCVVMSSMAGLQKQKAGVVIKGLEKIIPANDIFIFHDNTSFHNADIVTTGGRAVCITAFGTDLLNARTKAYSIIENIHFEGMYYRNDIVIILL